jgi:protein-S-isoprenylcysteine O-methyltransferase Ste14
VIPFPYNFTGILPIIGGLVVMKQTRELFTKHSTTLSISKSSSLIQEGVFSISRNPMYLEMFAVLVGLGTLIGNFVTLISPFVFVVAIHFVFVKREEKMMSEVFGSEYDSYKSKVRRWI